MALSTQNIHDPYTLLTCSDATPKSTCCDLSFQEKLLQKQRYAVSFFLLTTDTAYKKRSEERLRRRQEQQQEVQQRQQTSSFESATTSSGPSMQNSGSSSNNSNSDSGSTLVDSQGTCDLSTAVVYCYNNLDEDCGFWTDEWDQDLMKGERGTNNLYHNEKEDIGNNNNIL
ncbi:hypothetical protein BDA99DRAFT_532200 [Phascolomyces articulosus]|uniref:Uncharacterized protein n=1 Tax=Phascolomyces articulosus TaxID=60185 RepID=A0AAD5KPV1_9FUNG|nr:hypothetical protein BDA99DRAFT_532200 [Phascolomyces articulosus]